MVKRFLTAVILLVALSLWGVPPTSNAKSYLYYSARSENLLTATMYNGTGQNPKAVLYASDANGLMTIQVKLDNQSILVRKWPGALEISSSLNTNRSFARLSDEERIALGTLANLLDADSEGGNGFYQATICMLQRFSEWPSDMPLFVYKDSVRIVVGDLDLDRREWEEARRQALAEAFPQEAPEIEADKGFVTLCSKIGTKQSACYPVSLKPLKVKCEKVLVGGTECTGRCGSLCKGLCSGKKYTNDCFDHDRCADKYGLYHIYCDIIFANCTDDCYSAPNCIDVPGVWTITFKWKNYPQYSLPLNLYANHTLKDNTGFATGRWTVSGITLTLKFNGGCKPTYTGKLNDTRLRVFGGTMKCTVGSDSGTWFASKTDTQVLTGSLGAPDKHSVGLAGPPVRR